jgi:hypothetical protein
LVDRGVITGSAFVLRNNEGGLSINWLERLTGGIETRLAEVRRRARITYSNNGLLAVLGVGRTRLFVCTESSPQCDLRFVQDPLPATDTFAADDSHGLIIGVPEDGDSPEAEAVGDLIASCVERTFPASIQR